MTDEENQSEPDCRTDAQNANKYSDEELEESWRHYVEKYVNDELEGTDLLKLDAYETEMFNRNWTILVTEDRQEVDRNPEEKQ